MSRLCRLLVHTSLKDGTLVRAGTVIEEARLEVHVRKPGRFISYKLEVPSRGEDEEEVSRPRDLGHMRAARRLESTRSSEQAERAEPEGTPITRKR
jgi:hypothetical protein